MLSLETVQMEDFILLEIKFILDVIPSRPPEMDKRYLKRAR